MIKGINCKYLLKILVIYFLMCLYFIKDLPNIISFADDAKLVKIIKSEQGFY